MQNLLNDLTALLSKEEKYISEGRLLKNVITEDALKLEPSLLRILLSDTKIKKHFFQEVEDIFVFDKIKFQKFISNKQFLPDSYTAFKNKIGLTVGDEYISEKKDVVLSWPYKDCVLEGGQDKEDAKRDEIFWNETLAPDEIDRLLSPKVLANWKKYDKDGEHEVESINEEDNLIIKGNNLLGLTSILKKYRNRINMIYIDPPFNKDSETFYNDNFKHSTWYTFMKNRLSLAKELLANNGIIWVHLDDVEVHPNKMVMDEVFGKDRFVATIAYERSGSAGLGQSGNFVKTGEFIVCYANQDYVPYNNYGYIDLDYEKTRYTKILVSEGDKELVEEFKSKSNGEPVRLYKHENFSIRSISKRNLDERLGEIKMGYKTNFDNIFRTNNVQKENKFQNEIIQKQDKKFLYTIEYIPSRGKYKDKKTTLYYYNKELFAWLRDSAKVDRGDILKSNKLTNIWTHKEIPKADLANEGGIYFPRGKKPEQLLKRIIDISTQEGDIVLDFHLGSGTTCAVAHKMNRRYIGIEQLHYGENDSIVRLENVIGKTSTKTEELLPSLDFDKTGISKDVKWQGGGSFLYCELAKANQEYIDIINSAKETKELHVIWKVMQEKAFISYKVDIKSINENIIDFESLPIEDQKRFLIEVLDKNMLYIPYSEIDDRDYQISEADKKLNRMFYGDKK